MDKAFRQISNQKSFQLIKFVMIELINGEISKRYLPETVQSLVGTGLRQQLQILVSEYLTVFDFNRRTFRVAIELQKCLATLPNQRPLCRK